MASHVLPPNLTLDNFNDFSAFIKPSTDELKWTSIPWETDLWEARREAIRSRLPMFLWAMNGNPLGCV